MKDEGKAFLDWLAQWEADLPSLDLRELVSAPDCVAVLSVDLVKGFCNEGPLASPRVAGIVPAVVGLLRRAHDLGVRHFLLSQDAHGVDSVEFSAFPPHCVSGTGQSETIDDLKNLPFSDQFEIIRKDSISSSIGTDLDVWLDEHPEVSTFILVGDCTDLCLYQAAMYLRLRANVSALRDARFIVPANCVQTYDIPVDAAEEVGALPHDGDLLHRVFLYHMALNGVEVVAQVE